MLTTFSANQAKENRFTKTGHEQFYEIAFRNEDAFIINSLNDDDINNALKTLKSKFMGKRIKIFNDEEECTYVSYTIFSRSNKTRDEYRFEYDTSKVTYSSYSVTVKGSISLKAAFKIKNSKDSSAGAEISASGTKESYTKETETGKLNITVYPNKKISLRIIGDATLSNGVQKNYVFGICVKKGAWEIISIRSVCYELVEEDV